MHVFIVIGHERSYKHSKCKPMQVQTLFIDSPSKKLKHSKCKAMQAHTLQPSM